MAWIELRKTYRLSLASRLNTPRRKGSKLKSVYHCLSA